MSTNKNATIRYLTLDRCFQNPVRKYYIEDLVEACNTALLNINPNSSGIKRRQVYQDIKFMQDSIGFNAPVESYRDGRKTYYRYSQKGFSITSQPINEMEAQKLRESLLILSRFKGLPQFSWTGELITRLENTFHLQPEDCILSFDENPYLIGNEYLQTLYDAIICKKVLNITYKPFLAEKKLIFEIHPYHLKQYNNRWFLLGFNIEYENITTIALDRIQKIRESKTKYNENTRIDFSEYFEDVIGVSIDINQQPQKVILKIEDDLLPYISSKPIHGSQKIRKQENLVELSVQLNYELSATILSFGDKAEVLEPQLLRNSIAKKIKSLNLKYSNCVQPLHR